MQHVSNKHTNHPDKLFEECAHNDDIEPRKWIKVGTKAYEKILEILMKTSVLNDIKRLPQRQKPGKCVTLQFPHVHL